MTVDAEGVVERSQRRPLLLADETEDENLNNSTVSSNSIRERSLTFPLQILFALNGVTLALPTTAILYLVNTRVALPLPLLPSYAAVAFVPFSLKPAYAYASFFLQSWLPRDRQIAVLLTLSGLACAATPVLIHPHAVVACFALTFVRSFLAAWPEFLLGLTLIDEAVASSSSWHNERQPQSSSTFREDEVRSSYAETAAFFQSQAATARSIGSLLAHVGVLAFFAALQWMPSTFHDDQKVSKAAEALNDTTVAILFLGTGVLNGVGAAVAWTGRVGMTVTVDDPSRKPPFRSRSYNSLSEDNDSLPARSSAWEELVATEGLLPPDLDGEQEPSASHNSTATSTIRLVIVLQISVVLLTMRQPIAHATSNLGCNVLSCASILALLVVGYSSAVSSSSDEETWPQQQRQQHRVGLYLMLRNTVPSVSYLMSSYFYTIFASTPSFLQLLSLWDMIITTAACWTYGKFWSKYSQDQPLLWLIAGTTVLAATASFGNVALIKILDLEKRHLPLAVKAIATIVVKAVLGFTGEWKFLPDVVLATVSVNNGATSTGGDATSTRYSEEGTTSRSSLLDGRQSSQPRQQQQQATGVSLQYGTLISCIDFGSQLGALFAGPLVALFGTSRENDWAGLDWLQEINSILTLCSVAFLVLLVRY